MAIDGVENAVWSLLGQLLQYESLALAQVWACRCVLQMLEEVVLPWWRLL